MEATEKNKSDVQMFRIATDILKNEAYPKAARIRAAVYLTCPILYREISQHTKPQSKK